MKELWIASFEMLVEDYLEQGLTEAEAEKRAEDEAYDHMCELAAGQADFLRKQAKERQ